MLLCLGLFPVCPHKASRVSGSNSGGRVLMSRQQQGPGLTFQPLNSGRHALAERALSYPVPILCGQQRNSSRRTRRGGI